VLMAGQRRRGLPTFGEDLQLIKVVSSLQLQPQLGDYLWLRCECAATS
jgi:hypothetical protein